MSRPYTFRPKADWPKLAARIVRLTKAEPELSPQEVAERLGCSHVTVRKAQRAAGVYTPRGPQGVLR